MPRGTVFSLRRLVSVHMWIHACLCLCFCVIRAWCERRTVQVWVRWAGRSRSPGEVKRWGLFRTWASVAVHPHHIRLFRFFRNVFVCQDPGAHIMSSNFTSFISCEPVDIPVIDLSFYIYIYFFFFFLKQKLCFIFWKHRNILYCSLLTATRLTFHLFAEVAAAADSYIQEPTQEEPAEVALSAL